MKEMSFHQPSIFAFFDDFAEEVWGRHPGVTLLGPGTSTHVAAADV
jgi:hypothetical protein